MAPSINRNRNHGHGNGNRNSSSVPPSRPLRHRGHRGHHDHRDHGPRRLGLGLQLDLPAKTALSVTEEEGEGGNYDGNVYGDDDDIVLDDNYQDDDDDVQDGEDDDVQDGEDDDDDEAEDSLPAPRTPPKVRTPKFVLPMLPPSAEKETGAQDSMEDELPDADVATLLLTPPLFAASSSSSPMEDEPPTTTTTTTMMVTSLAPPSERVAGEEDWNSNSTTDSNGSSEFESIPAPPIALDAVEAETVAEAEEGVEPGGMIGSVIGENGDSVVVAVAEEETKQKPHHEGDWMEGDVHGTLLENKMDDDHDGDEKSEEMEPVVAEEKKEEDVDEEATEDVALLAGAEGETEAETIVDETNATGDNNEEPELEKDSIVDKEQEPEENEELVEEEKEEKEAEEKDAEEEQQPPQQPQNEINDTANEGISPPDPETTTNQPTNDETNTLSEGSNDVPEINDQTVQTSWEGFDDIDNHNHNPEQDDPHEYEPDVDSSSSSSSSHSSPEYDDQDASAPSSSFRPDELAYEGDGFHNDNHNATLPSHSTTNNIHNLLPLPLGAILGLATLPLLYYLFHRCRRRRFLDSQKKIDYNRGRYAAIAGGGDYDYDDNADFFSNDFFSEDVSFRGKDSDEDEEDWSVGSEEDVRGGGVNGNGKGMVRIEMGGIHETDANGGLTLEEING